MGQQFVLKNSQNILLFFDVALKEGATVQEEFIFALGGRDSNVVGGIIAFCTHAKIQLKHIEYNENFTVDNFVAFDGRKFVVKVAPLWQENVITYR